jgi:hypothetical protein
MRTLALLSTTLLVLGCSTTSFIYKKDGTVIEGEIRRSDASTIIVVPAEPSERYVIAPSEIPERDKGTIVPELLDECATRKISRCKEKCRDRYIDGITDAEALKCVKSCPDRNKATSLCEAISVEIPISRADIDDIDHPGDIAACIGWPLGVLGIVMTTVVAISITHDEEVSVAAVPLFLLGAITTVSSFVIAIWGTATYNRSIYAAMPPATRKKPSLTPVALSDGERTYWGLGMSWSW